MKDIIQEAQALLDQHGPESVRRANYFSPVVRGLLERVRELERVYVPVGNGSPETLLRLLDENRSLELQLEQAQRERDAALERVRVLEEVYEAAKPVAAQWVWSSKASHPNYSSHVWASDHTQLYSAVCKALEPGEELRPRGIVEETPHV